MYIAVNRGKIDGAFYGGEFGALVGLLAFAKWCGYVTKKLLAREEITRIDLTDFGFPGPK